MDEAEMAKAHKSCGRSSQMTPARADGTSKMRDNKERTGAINVTLENEREAIVEVSKAWLASLRFGLLV